MDIIEVIYIEDDEQEGLIMTIGMRRFGIKIVHIPHLPLENVNQLQQPPYDKAVAIMLDSLLVGQNGMNIARMLRELGEKRPMFLVTGVENPNQDLLKQHAVHYFRKPIKMDELAAALRSAN